ncbi:hypothetical protein TrST_g2631 [Triparma strigata]|uniref:C3H1-type domain-containing protein n=1 Tax=Triparma strigata TaxID=1606541 RepID=A0A9W7EC75_9STRA|nr:hypothetical protein TrST_g2631 [Triparma strigata]
MAQPPPDDTPSPTTLQSLPGFVFHCNKNTLPECLHHSTFGGGVEFRHLKLNSPLWLLNYSDKSISGLYYAKSLHTYYDNHLWGGKYKWQVQVGKIFDGKMPEKTAMKLIGRQGTRKPTSLTADESRLLVEEFIDRFYKPQKLRREREEKARAKRVATITSNPNSFVGLDSDESDEEESKPTRYFICPLASSKVSNKTQQKQNPTSNYNMMCNNFLKYNKCNKPDCKYRHEMDETRTMETLTSTSSLSSRLRSNSGALSCFELMLFGVCKVPECNNRHVGIEAFGNNLQTEFEELRVKKCKNYSGSTCKRPACPFRHELDAKATAEKLEHPYIVILRNECITGSIMNLRDRILAQKFKYFFSKPREVQIFLRDLFCQYIFMTTGKIGTAALNDFVLVCGETEPSGEIWKLIRRGKGRLISELQSEEGKDEARKFSKMVALEIKTCSREIRKSVDSLANKKSINDRRMNMKVDAPDNSKSKVSIYFNTNSRKYKVELSKPHFDFLVEAYDSNPENSPDLKLIRIWNCVVSYHRLGDLRVGYHSSIPPPVVSVLQSEYGTTHECFASPLNRTMENYNSLLFEYDKWFGSDGSFFKDNKEEGCFECNPPFDKHTVESAILEIRDRLERSERSNAPLSYVIILPFLRDHKKIFDDEYERKDLRGIKKFVRWNANIPAGAKFALGSQSDMSERNRKGMKSKDISWELKSKIMFVVCQNERGMAKWPVDEKKFEKVKAAFTKKFNLDDLATSKLGHKLLNPHDILDLYVNDDNDDDLFADTEEDRMRAELQLKMFLGLVDEEGIPTKSASPQAKPTTKPKTKANSNNNNNKNVNSSRDKDQKRKFLMATIILDDYETELSAVDLSNIRNFKMYQMENITQSQRQNFLNEREARRISGAPKHNKAPKKKKDSSNSPKLAQWAADISSNKPVFNFEDSGSEDGAHEVFDQKLSGSPPSLPFLSDPSEENPEENDQDAFDRAKELLYGPDVTITPSEQKVIEEYLLDEKLEKLKISQQYQDI